MRGFLLGYNYVLEEYSLTESGESLMPYLGTEYITMKKNGGSIQKNYTFAAVLKNHVCEQTYIE